jgi:hypothetical protein
MSLPFSQGHEAVLHAMGVDVKPGDVAVVIDPADSRPTTHPSSEGVKKAIDLFRREKDYDEE